MQNNTEMKILWRLQALSAGSLYVLLDSPYLSLRRAILATPRPSSTSILDLRVWLAVVPLFFRQPNPLEETGYHLHIILSYGSTWSVVI